MSKRFNPNRVKVHRSYTVKDASETIGAHVKTVRNWIHAGLPVIKETGPLLIQGADLKLYLKQKRKTYLHRCELNEMFCFKCKVPKKPSIDSVEFIAVPSGSAQMTGRCAECDKQSNKFVSWRDLNQIWTELGGKLPIAEKHLILRGQKPLNYPFAKVFNDEKK
ncbi:helix-turn-helix domain-containing protein [Shewanella sp. KX20019]|uniref:helix-turn-helix domain-containing protein n=1 Tax=Shewanella sp. KX20019 TaxID=2803864 RepID=UPI0019293F14|nr:helix-turn-helix domain-containing protein [Shewanella sp. KX20019]QQX81683.1 helix-turn-helix domain-containing protein [Shewanella sp. KX20019]